MGNDENVRHFQSASNELLGQPTAHFVRTEHQASLLLQQALRCVEKIQKAEPTGYSDERHHKSWDKRKYTMKDARLDARAAAAALRKGWELLDPITPNAELGGNDCRITPTTDSAAQHKPTAGRQ